MKNQLQIVLSIVHFLGQKELLRINDFLTRNMLNYKV